MADTLGVLLISDGLERAHYAFVVATAAAAIGRDVTLFATNGGCHALLDTPPYAGSPYVGSSYAGASYAGASYAGASYAGASYVGSSNVWPTIPGVATLAELRDAALALGIRMMACPMGLRLAGLEGAALAPGVVVAGVPSFLAAASGQVITL